MKSRRWSNRDFHLWPFTWSVSKNSRFGIMLDSGAREGGGGDCHIRFSAFGYVLICELPQIIPHYVERRSVIYRREEFIARTGRDYYEDVFPREYGFHFFEGAVHVHYGAQTHDSSTTKSSVYFLPWKAWRHVRQSFYGLEGEHFASIPERPRIAWEAQDAIKNACPKVRFAFEDYDGQSLIATTHIEEREWLAGEGWFRWLSWFRRPKVRRTLKIEFSGETGKEKGSWKGGTIGTGIEMMPGELHEAAFRRYCEQEHRSKNGSYRIRFIGPAAAEAA